MLTPCALQASTAIILRREAETVVQCQLQTKSRSRRDNFPLFGPITLVFA